METQTSLLAEVARRASLLCASLGLGALGQLGSASGGEPETEFVHRKAVRSYPVAHRAHVDPPVTRQAIPLEEFRRIPRATVVGHRPAELQASVPVEEPAVAPIPEISVAPRETELDQHEPEPVVEVRPRPEHQPRHSPRPGSVASLVRRCDQMALQGLSYRFGGDDPSSGGLDCSGAVQYLLRQEGVRDVPRTAYTQYQWLKEKGTLSRVSRWSWSASRVASKLKPGDLMFWTGTYNTGKHPNISHVMIYLGRDARNGKHYMFGASSRRSKGVHGNAVDVYEFVYPRKHGKDNFAGFGRVPGLAR